MEVTINEIVNVLLGGGALGGLLKIIRTVEKIEAKVEVSEKNITALWERANEQTKEISDVGKIIAEERGRREGEHQKRSDHD